MTLGDAAAGVRLIIWCKEWQHQVGPDPAEQITSAMFTGMGLLGMAAKRPCSIGANAGLFLARQPAGRYGGDRDQVGVAPPLACAHRRQNQSRNARRALRLRRAIARYRASNAADEQHNPGPDDHH